MCTFVGHASTVRLLLLHGARVADKCSVCVGYSEIDDELAHWAITGEFERRGKLVQMNVVEMIQSGCVDDERRSPYILHLLTTPPPKWMQCNYLIGKNERTIFKSSLLHADEG
jgi:hypothetical protein